MRKAALVLLACLLALTTYQVSSDQHPLLTPSNMQALDEYASFDEYLVKTKALIADHRHFLTSDRAQEIAANSPFELSSTQPAVVTKGVLLIHGLGDSPFSFADIGRELAQQGFRVRTVLLSGHGTRPADMIDARFEDWRLLVSRHVELLKTDVDEVYLGGFSTGGNLAYLHAANDPAIKGLMLFSPGFKSDGMFASFTPLISVFKTWLLTGTPDEETNYARYSAMPSNGFAQYYHSSAAVLERLKEGGFDRPVFLALSEHDSILDTRLIRSLFDEHFSHPNSRLMWFGSEPDGVSGRTITVDSRVPHLRISNMSHMGLLFSPSNLYYGESGSERICDNGQTVSNAVSDCKSGKPVWYSTWGHSENDKNHARLTFNPAFEQMVSEMLTVFD